MASMNRRAGLAGAKIQVFRIWMWDGARTLQTSEEMKVCCTWRPLSEQRR